MGQGRQHKPDSSIDVLSVLSLRSTDFDPIGGVKLSGETPSRRYRKDLIRVGDYYKAGTNQSFTVTLSRLNHWAETFDKMKAAGVKVPVPNGHTFDAEANRGYVEDVYVEGGTLYMVAELIGTDALALADRAEVSIFVEPVLIDGKGAEYRDAITHVAIVTNPVIPAQDRFIPIAASRSGGAATRALAFSLAEPKGVRMEALKKVAEALGASVADDADEAAALAAIMAAIDAMKSEMSAAKEGYEEKDKELAASRDAGKPVTLDADTKATLSEAAHAQFGMAVDAGAITPAVRDGVVKLFGDNPIALSRTAAAKAGFGEVSILASLAKILAQNKPVAVGEKTGVQTLALGRSVPGAVEGMTAQKRDALINESVARLGLAKSK